MVTRPRTHKLFTRNAGPFIVTKIAPPHVYLQSLTSGAPLKEHVKNVRPLHVHLYPPTSPLPPSFPEENV